MSIESTDRITYKFAPKGVDPMRCMSGSFGVITDSGSEAAIRQAFLLREALNEAAGAFYRPPDLDSAFDKSSGNSEAARHAAKTREEQIFNFNLTTQFADKGGTAEEVGRIATGEGAAMQRNAQIQQKNRIRSREAFIEAVMYATLTGYYSSFDDFYSEFDNYLQDLRSALADQRQHMIGKYGPDHVERFAKMYLDEEDYTRLPGESDAQYQLRLERQLMDRLVDEHGNIRDGLDEEGREYASELIKENNIERKLRAADRADIRFEVLREREDLSEKEKLVLKDQILQEEEVYWDFKTRKTNAEAGASSKDANLNNVSFALKDAAPEAESVEPATQEIVAFSNDQLFN